MLKKTAVSLALLLGLQAAPARASTYWTEDWEDPASVVAQSPDHWSDTSCGAPWPSTSNPGLSTNRAFSGTHSLRHHFNGHQQSHIDGGFTTGPLGTQLGGGCSASRHHTATDDLWLTYYEWMDTGFIVDEIGTKALRIGSNEGVHWAGVYMWGGRQMSFSCQRCKVAAADFGNTKQYYQNMTAFDMPDNNWVCYELHFKYNAPGQADAVYEGFATNMTRGTPTVQFAGYYGQEWRGALTTDGLPSHATFNQVEEYVQDGLGELYRDKISVSNTRIGCNGTPPPPPPIDTQAPSVPAGLSAQAASSSQINLTWNASSDNVGVTGYKIFRGGAQIATTAGTSYSDAGLSASTAYSYTVAAYDAAGNNSGQSAAASATTQASAPPPPPPPGAVGVVSNLAVPQASSSGATLSFTEVDDGTGQPAKYDIRFLSPVMNWGSASSVAQGTCAVPLAGAQIGATKTCTVLGLSPSTDYQFQLVPFRGTMNVDAVFGSLSNIAGARTSSAVDAMPPAKPRNMRVQ